MRTIAGVCHYAASLLARRPLPPVRRRPDGAQANPSWRPLGASPTLQDPPVTHRQHWRGARPPACRSARLAGPSSTRTPVRPGRVPRAAEMRYPMEAPGRGCGGDLDPTGQHRTSDGRLAQRESASFTPRRSLVRSQYRPQMFGQVRGSTDSSHPIRRTGAVAILGGIWEIVFYAPLAAQTALRAGRTRAGHGAASDSHLPCTTGQVPASLQVGARPIGEPRRGGNREPAAATMESRRPAAAGSVPATAGMVSRPRRPAAPPLVGWHGMGAAYAADAGRSARRGSVRRGPGASRPAAARTSPSSGRWLALGTQYPGRDRCRGRHRDRRQRLVTHQLGRQQQFRPSRKPELGGLHHECVHRLRCRGPQGNGGEGQ
jgi:hypothetical protein